ncbi:MAG TPA: class I SAM-dependent methyltransferase [Candidatus Dormibacteraeota bacterium]|jgi:demethylmenaquinone methyltransferase/2-methoxy-6-polyprenyl-1,4-benzoquinol methylase/phosphoethanolamine N-methyltransferase|nr:class I SAM-dependent methyltransferase [Candidatus Dormibacteraeota bacterium]
MADRIDQDAVGEQYAEWFTRGLRGIGMRYVFSRRGLWVINTPYRQILAAAGISADDRVLDLGCGIGNILIAVCETIAFKHAPVGVDVSPALIELGKREVAKAGFEGRIDLRVGAATTLAFSDESFDVVLTSHVIKHLDDIAVGRAFAEVHRVLSPGGRFLLWEFKKSPFSAPLFLSARASGLPPAFTLRDERTLGARLTAAGFERVNRVNTGFFLMPPVPRLALLATR